MKKLTIGLAVLLSGVAANSFASLPNGGSKYGVCVPNFCGGFTFGLAGLYWRPSAPELDYALTYPTSDVLDFTDGHYHSVEPDYDWGFRANIGYVFPCSGNDVTLAWTHFDHDDTDRVGNPGILLPSLSGTFNPASPFAFPLGFPFTVASITPVIEVTATAGFEGLFTPLLTIPLDSTFVDLAAAKADFRVDAVDLEFGQSVNVGCNLHLRWYGGLRYAKLENKLHATYDALDVPLTTVAADVITVVAGATTATVSITATFDILANLREVINQKSDFEGIGPRFGVDASYAIGCSGFGIVGGISTSLLIGEIDSTLFNRVEDTTVAFLDTATVTIAGTDATFPVTIAGVTVPVEGVSTLIGATFTSSDAAELSFKHPDETRIVPNIDAKLGVDYTYAFCNPSHSKLTIEAGWMVSHYFNAIDRLSAVGAVGPEFRTRHTTDVSFDGPYIGVQVNI